MAERIFVADYHNPTHGADIVSLLDHYAQDEMGGGKPLDPLVADTLIGELAKRAYAFSVLAYVDDIPAGLVNCFEGFSTFACKPLVNIHDLVVHQQFRGRGLSHRMLDAVAKHAEQLGCAKLTLEVLTNNTAATASYKAYGFAPYELDPQAGPAQFWQKTL